MSEWIHLVCGRCEHDRVVESGSVTNPMCEKCKQGSMRFVSKIGTLELGMLKSLALPTLERINQLSAEHLEALKQEQEARRNRDDCEKLMGTKHDGGKTRLDLLSSTWIYGVGAVLTSGAAKYSAHNWRKGIKLSRLLGACLRHVFSYLGGENMDPETGKSHLLHASCCLMFAYELMETSPSETDDRYKKESK